MASGRAHSREKGTIGGQLRQTCLVETGEQRDRRMTQCVETRGVDGAKNGLQFGLKAARGIARENVEALAQRFDFTAHDGAPSSDGRRGPSSGQSGVDDWMP